MKPEILIVYLFVMTGIVPTCKKSAQNAAYEPCTIMSDSIAIASKLLTLPDAVKIMGESAELTCNTYTKKSDTLEYRCDYMALSQTDISRKLYFMYEIYEGIGAAKNAYATIYQANRGHEGVEIVTGLGDEAYYHSDGANFYFFLVRKNEKLFRIKLNKVTSLSSEANFKEVAKGIVSKI